MRCHARTGDSADDIAVDLAAHRCVSLFMKHRPGPRVCSSASRPTAGRCATYQTPAICCFVYWPPHVRAFSGSWNPLFARIVAAAATRNPAGASSPSRPSRRLRTASASTTTPAQSCVGRGPMYRRGRQRWTARRIMPLLSSSYSLVSAASWHPPHRKGIGRYERDGTVHCPSEEAFEEHQCHVGLG